jgi:biofilm PGA synthesis N-glycosyltransferase PgaC
MPSYVLITPAKNEQATIGETLASVIGQTVRPAEWVIVSDGSTDRTDEIVLAAAARNPWIRLLPLPPRAQRSFGAVVHATEKGVLSLSISQYDYIGLLDADIRFAADYFEQVIKQFESSPRLGLAGGVVIDVGQSRHNLPKNRADVPGATQLFRRECFEALGGLVAVPEGGWDGLTCAKARMAGYQTKLLTALVVDHLKPRNISEGGWLRRRWQMGVRDYAVGYHPFFELVKCLSRAFESPPIVGALAWWIGYCSAAIQRRNRLVPPVLLQFVRAEQMSRLKRLVGMTSPARCNGMQTRSQT